MRSEPAAADTFRIPRTRLIRTILLPRLKQYRKPIAALLCVSTASALLQVTGPVFAGLTLNAIVARRGTWVLVSLALLSASPTILGSALTVLQRSLAERTGGKLVLNLRLDAFSHIQRMPISFFRNVKTGMAVSRVMFDTRGAQGLFTSVFSILVLNGVQIIVTLAVMMVTTYQVTALVLLTFPLFVIPSRFVSRRLVTIQRDTASANAEAMSHLSERFSASGALLVKLFGSPVEEFEDFHEHAAKLRHLGVRSAMLSQWYSSALTVAPSIAQVLVYGIGGTLVLRHQLQPGSVIMLAMLLTRIYVPLSALTNVRRDIATSLVSFERLHEVLMLTPTVVEKHHAAPIGVPQASLEFAHVEFTYPKTPETSLNPGHGPAIGHGAPRTVLKGVSFRVEAGMHAALVGASGAGKSTIASLALRLYDPDAGSVLIGGTDVRDFTLRQLRRTVSFVSQDAHLFHATIRENLSYVRPNCTDAVLWDALRKARLERFLRSLPDGLETMVGDAGLHLSGGERQRLAIARMLLCDARIVVLDEPTAHLDPGLEAELQMALDETLAGRTSLVIAHRLSTVESADLILMMVDGRIVEQGRHRDLVALGGHYASHCQGQVRRGAVDAIGPLAGRDA